MERRQSWKHIRKYKGQVRRNSELGLRSTALRIPMDLQGALEEEMAIQGFRAKSKFIIRAVRHYVNMLRLRRGERPL